MQVKSLMVLSVGEPKVEIEIMRGSYQGRLALAINEKRHGPDAGPWTTIEKFSVPVSDLKKAIEKVGRK